MAIVPEHTIDHYRKAFLQFVGYSAKDFQIIKGDGAHAYYEGETYRICHYDDLISDLKDFFKDDLSMVYTELPFEIWEILFDKHDDITEDDLIIDIYSSWKKYWKNQQDNFESEARHKQSMDNSWKDFEALIAKLRAEPGGLVVNAVAISDVTLIPVLALALRSRFKDEEDFYRQCLDTQIEAFPDTFGEDGNFDELEVDITGNGDMESFYIFMPGYKFDDIKDLYL